MLEAKTGFRGIILLWIQMFKGERGSSGNRIQIQLFEKTL